MARKLIVNPDHFRLSTPQLYDFLCKKLLEKRIIKGDAQYEIYSADDAGIQYIRLSTGKESHMLKEEVVEILNGIRKSHEYKDLKTPITSFLIASDILY